MAQQDTGLGWSAESEWLLNTAGTMASTTIIIADDYPDQPVPDVAGSAASMWAGGITIARSTSTGNIVKAGATSGKTAFVAIDSTYGSPNNVKVWGISTSNIGVVELLLFSATGSRIYGYTISTNVYNATTGLYYGYTTITNRNVDDTLTTPKFQTIEGAMAAISVNQVAFNKTNPGYCVACTAKWTTSAGRYITTPILISSESENVDMNTTYSGVNFAKLNFTYDGMPFYMGFFDLMDATLVSGLQSADLTYLPVLALQGVFNVLASETWANILVNETVDPYAPFGNTEEGGGEIDPDPEDDDIEVDPLPTRSFATAGFCRIFNPDISDLNDLASYMWTDQTFLQTVINHLKQILENPIEAIISLSLVPVTPPTSGTKVPVNVMFIDTGVTMRPVTSQFVSIDCGTLSLEESRGGALDYNPYTKVHLYLPYIGTVQLDTDEVMAKTLHIIYHVDVVTGICCAEISANNKLMYQFSGHCSVSQPITSADFGSYLNAALAAAKLAVGVATGMSSTAAGAAAAGSGSVAEAGAASGGTIMSDETALVPVGSGAIGPHLGSPSRTGWTDFSNIPEPAYSKGQGVKWGELATPGNINTAAATMGGKMVVQHSGGFSGNSGYLAKRRPYLIIERPRIANPEEYAQHNGRPCMMYLNLGACTGYTKVQSVHLTGFNATNPELSEISSLLKGGVIF